MEIIYKSKLDDLSERSGEVKDILGKPPSWMIRWGIAVVFSIICLILLGCAIISYNDIISSRVIITTENPPAYIKSKYGGNLKDVLIKANDSVKKDQVLAIINNNADYKHVERVKKELGKKPEINNFNQLDSIFPTSLNLGEIQQEYHAVIKNYQAVILQKQLIDETNEFDLLDTEIESQLTLFKRKRKQLKLYQQQLHLTYNKYKRSKKLFKKGVIAQSEFENIKKEYLSDKQRLEGLKSEISNSELAIDKQKQNKSITELNETKTSRNNSFALLEALQRLSNAISNWEERYILKSPIEGTVAIFDIWSKYQNVTPNQVLFTVVPFGQKNLIGRMHIPIQNSSKIKIGQKVIIKLDNYASNEWGSIEGEVMHMSSVPSKSDKPMYTAVISIRSLLSTYNKELEFKQEMQGKADIITEELSILERIFYQTRKVFNKVKDV